MWRQFGQLKHQVAKCAKCDEELRSVANACDARLPISVQHLWSESPNFGSSSVRQALSSIVFESFVITEDRENMRKYQ